MQQNSAVHVIMKVMPRTYHNTLNYYHGVIEHKHPFIASFGTMMSREKLRQFKEGVSANHGDAVEIREAHGMGHTEVTLAYSPRHFDKEEAVYGLVEGTLNLARMMHIQSKLVPPDQC